MAYSKFKRFKNKLKQFGEAVIAGPKERFQATREAIKTRSLEPLKKSFAQQNQQLFPQPTDSRQDSLNKTIALVSGTVQGPARLNKLKTGPRTFKPTLRKTLFQQTRPAINVIKAEGQAGKELASRITRAADVGEVNAGKRISAISKAPRLTRTERFNVADVLEGKAEPLNDAVKKTVKIYRSTLDDVAKEAVESKIKVKRKVTLYEEQPGLTPLQRDKIRAGKPVRATVYNDFKPKENYFPHTIPTPDDLAKGKVRIDVAENLVRQGVRKTAKEAEQFIDEYRNFVETGAQQDSLIDYMVETGQAKDTAEAFRNLQVYRKRTIKRGATEYAREVDLPFYDPDAQRAVQKYLVRESKRLPEIREFGQNQERVNNLIKNIRDSGGDADTVRIAVDRIQGLINSSPGVRKVSLLLRTLQGFKLGLAAIPNLTQGVLNSWLKGDLRAVAAGLKGIFSKEGRDLALRSGATLESVIQEAGKSTGALSKFLKATGFTLTERVNRTVAANAGRSYGTRIFKRALKNPSKTNKRLLEEFGINVDEALKRGSLNDDDILMMAKKFTDITQFRSRPQDLPLFASTEAGKVFFQFKNFIYGQTRLVGKSVFGELRAGNYGKGIKNLLLLATVFPLAGEAVADIRALATGREREAKGLARYFEDIAQVGAMGILYDAIKSGGYGMGAEAIAGPTVSDAGALLNAAGGPNKGKNLGKFVTKRIPLIGNRVTDAAFPKETKSKRVERKRKSRSTPRKRRRF